MSVVEVHIADCEDLIQIEAEQFAEDLFGTSYFDLSPEERGKIRSRVIESLWPEYVNADLLVTV